MTWLRFIFALWLLCLGCSEKKPDAPSVHPAIASTFFGAVESELTPAILVHGTTKYLGLFADADAPSHVAFATRSGPRSFRNGEKLNAAEFEECWLLVWWTNRAPWAVFLQRRPLALTLDRDGLHFSFEAGAGDVVLLPFNGSSTNIDTRKWPEFLLREPLLRVRYWASVLREFPIESETSFALADQTVTVQQKFRFHSIRDEWNTKAVKLAPVSPPLAQMADEKLRKELRELEMPTPFGPYKGLEGVAEWRARFPLTFTLHTNCAWVMVGTNCIPGTNTALIHPIERQDWPCIAGYGCIKAFRDGPSGPAKVSLLSGNSRLIAYER